ncbi:MAG: ArsB/NhaD family transporter [Bacilli bacterium]|jgi:arsenical pump membrane protein|nr:ArsB/NhaD family transporter [Bacilli bacterium]MDY0063815.1 ArsB/NhaD family transporter [Bacilli bacterium]
MIATIFVSVVTSILLVLSIVFIPKIKIGHLFLDTYWIVALIGAIILFVFDLLDLKEVIKALLSDGVMNPIKIVILFLSMSVLSLFLDEIGFFRYIASWVHQRTKSKQLPVFLSLYLVISVLTIFTSNDIIILTFTPFLCYFAKNAKINPIPYLVMEFIAANTWSMLLVIGNPTNIYLASMYQIDFLLYLQKMFVPTLLAGIGSFILMLILFRKNLQKPMEQVLDKVAIKNKLLFTVGMIHLLLCTVFLAISNYIGLEMWLISFGFAVSLFVFLLLFKKKSSEFYLPIVVKRMPWSLMPFVISMFLIVLGLSKYQVTNSLLEFFNNFPTIYSFGLFSFLFSNLINNIPMSVLFAEIIQPLSALTLEKALFASIIGSNVGAFLTPVGALAGMMWMGMLKKESINFGFKTFIRTNSLLALASIILALVGLMIVF